MQNCSVSVDMDCYALLRWAPNDDELNDCKGIWDCRASLCNGRAELVPVRREVALL